MKIIVLVMKGLVEREERGNCYRLNRFEILLIKCSVCGFFLSFILNKDVKRYEIIGKI